MAYRQLIGTALRLDRLAGAVRLRRLTMERLTKEWSRHLEESRLLHVWLQLEVASLAQSVGASVEFETPVELDGTSRRADVLMMVGTDTLLAECFCVLH